VNIAARLQALAVSRTIISTKPVVPNEQAAEVLGAAGLEPDPHEALLRGFAVQVTV
jgi:hypothetical protein